VLLDGKRGGTTSERKKKGQSERSPKGGSGFLTQREGRADKLLGVKNHILKGKGGKKRTGQCGGGGEEKSGRNSCLPVRKKKKKKRLTNASQRDRPQQEKRLLLLRNKRGGEKKQRKKKTLNP